MNRAQMKRNEQVKKLIAFLGSEEQLNEKWYELWGRTDFFKKTAIEFFTTNAGLAQDMLIEFCTDDDGEFIEVELRRSLEMFFRLNITNEQHQLFRILSYYEDNGVVA